MLNVKVTLHRPVPTQWFVRMACKVGEAWQYVTYEAVGQREAEALQAVLEGVIELAALRTKDHPDSRAAAFTEAKIMTCGSRLLGLFDE